MPVPIGLLVREEGKGVSGKGGIPGLNGSGVALLVHSALLGHADELLDARRVTLEEVRFLSRRLRTALLDVHRVAESRGARLAVSERRL
ncbi:hypothetical protein GCM10010211_63600 [Streptomyces albospinus]|uniref:Uncharacterized protein n=1 Tax=Streptomyces albospinus TaxID=285515 RepID=A0ABQ2VLU9_9ACTN|nr:hypothetical protein GCM10010211_63600 [Streptomyces albospinus]